MTIRDVYFFFFQRFLVRLGTSSLVVSAGWAVVATLGQPLTRSEQVAATGITVCAATIAVAWFRRGAQRRFRDESWTRRVFFGAGIVISGVGCIVLLQGRARAVTINAVAPDCSPTTQLCRVGVHGTLGGQALAPREAVLVLFRERNGVNWTIGDVTAPQARRDGVWSGTFVLDSSKVGKNFEVLGIVGGAAARRGDALQLDGFHSRLEPHRLTLADTPRATAAPDGPCCGGSACAEKMTWCSSGWSRVPCDNELQNPSRQWLLRLGVVRPRPPNDEDLLTSSEEFELCVRAGGELQCVILPESDGRFPKPLSTSALQSSMFTASLRVRASGRDEWTLVGRGQHHRVLVVPQAVCNGFLVPLGGDRFESLSFYLDPP